MVNKCHEEKDAMSVILYSNERKELVQCLPNISLYLHTCFVFLKHDVLFNTCLFPIPKLCYHDLSKNSSLLV